MANGQVTNAARIVVLGVGGAGSNAVDRMIAAGLFGVEFVALNTDQQALARSRAPRRVRLGEQLTGRLGAGGDLKTGEKAAEECAEEIFDLCRGADMVFIAAGMGGGTGSGASPIIAQMAREAGALTVGVVTRPFAFEGSRRRRNAEEGIARLRERLHTLIVIPNDRILQFVDKRTTIESAFSTADDVLRQGIQGISELITRPGLINLDFADVKTVMSESGIALMAIGNAIGENRAAEAAQQAMASPLLDLSMEGARGVLFNITSGPELSLAEIEQAAEIIRRAADPDANIIFGAVIDESMANEVRITVIATGFNSASGRFPRAAAAEAHPEREPPSARSRANSGTTRSVAPEPDPSRSGLPGLRQRPAGSDDAMPRAPDWLRRPGGR